MRLANGSDMQARASFRWALKGWLVWNGEEVKMRGPFCFHAVPTTSQVACSFDAPVQSVSYFLYLVLLHIQHIIFATHFAAKKWTFGIADGTHTNKQKTEGRGKEDKVVWLACGT